MRVDTSFPEHTKVYVPGSHQGQTFPILDPR